MELYVFVFCDWLVSCSIMSSKFIHIVSCVRISFFLWPNNISLCVCSTFCLSIYPLRGPGLLAPLGHHDLRCSGCGVRWESDRGLERIGLSGVIPLNSGAATHQSYQEYACMRPRLGVPAEGSEELWHPVGCICSSVLPSRRALPEQRI